MPPFFEYEPPTPAPNSCGVRRAIAARMRRRAGRSGFSLVEVVIAIGVIAFGRWRASTWKMLAPDFAMPAKSLTPGSIQVVSDEVRECQAVLTTPAEAREYALSGTVSPLPYGMPGAPVQAAGGPVQAGTLALRSGENQAFVSADQGFSVSVVPSGTPAVTLREAVDAGVLRMTLAAARKRRTRDASFPADVGRDGTEMLYDLTALADWASARNN